MVKQQDLREINNNAVILQDDERRCPSCGTILHASQCKGLQEICKVCGKEIIWISRTVPDTFFATGRLKCSDIGETCKYITIEHVIRGRTWNEYSRSYECMFCGHKKKMNRYYH